MALYNLSPSQLLVANPSILYVVFANYVFLRFALYLDAQRTYLFSQLTYFLKFS